MPTIIGLEEIKSIVNTLDVVAAMEEGFIQYSNGNTVVPPVGELILENPPGEVHIKYGYIKSDNFYVIKIASGFYENSTLGLPSGQGLMLLFNQKTGQLVSILLDEAYLTDIRTAAAGALAAKYYAPKKLRGIGIIGTGIQAKLQLQFLKKNHTCNKVWVWGRNRKNVGKFKSEMDGDFDVNIASSPSEVAQHCNLIVTTTPSKTPLLHSEDISPGTHITAVGSDTTEKQELDGKILQNADKVIADSLSQSENRGEIFRAMKAGQITKEKIVELGRAIQDPSLQRMNEEELTVVDLTGVAVQDIMVAKAVYLTYQQNSK